MKKITFLKIGIFLVLMLLSVKVSMAQNLVPFSPRYDQAIKGDMLLIGNSNLGVHPTDPYSGTNNNESSANRDRMVYVDIDSDATTFNSSSADLDVPTDTNCYQIVYAGLYWSAVVKGDTPRETIKFRTPGSSAYVDITGTEVYYQNSSDDSDSNTYVYYRDVTDILAALPNPEGTYGVANISSMTSAMMNSGDGRNQEGLSAGWSLFVIYEDPLLPSKYITSFDGYTKIDNVAPNNLETFPISGFQTIPVGPVRAKFAFSALEGDRSWSGDYLELNGTRIGATNASGTVIRPNNNFFNSSVSIIDPATNSPVSFTDRNPNSTNTLGFDAGIINIPNAGNTLIQNGDTSATIRLGTNTDIYYFYFSAFAIEIIAPNIVLTKIVEDSAGNDIGGQYVNLGDELNYVIGFQNTGNDDATDLIIRDVLPINIVFNYPEDIVSLPPGVTVQSYDPATRELVFSVDESVVEENDPVSEIRFKVTVVSTCSLLSDACANNIDNQAYATYKGTINPDFVISDDPSYASNTGCLITPGATNFIADINDCTFEENVVLCGTSTVLTSGNGYDAYTWTNASGTVIGDTQSITVTSPGTYYVHNAAVAPCQSTDQVFNVITYGAGITNPVIPYADEVVVCPNDGKELPNIFLCGGNDSEFIQTNINDSTSIIWEKLDESSCAAVINEDCANEDPGCTWNQVGTGADFLANAAGQYRLTINYPGGCFNQFYFNVYQNLLVPTVTSNDIICSTPGEIRVGNVPSGYEYSIDGTNYQASNVFSVTTPGTYSVYVRQVGVSPNPCIFTAPDVQIRERNFTVSTIITQPYCNGEKGSVVLAANDADPQYFFSIYQGATLINSVGPITPNSYAFSNLNPGTYTINVSTDDGCTYSENIEIVEPPLLTATVALTQPLTCDDGEITVYPSGGTAPYYYFVNSTTEFQSTPQIVVNAPGVYNITVVDANNCSAETSITVEATPEPDFTVTATDITCYDSGDAGVVNINVTNAYGSSLMYSIDNGATFFSSPVFTNLAAGSYDVVVQYSLGGSVCTTAPQTVNINIPPAITATATLTAPYTCTGTGAITVSGVSGGVAPYTYSINGVNFQSGTTFTGLTNGTYTITVRDASGCTFTTAPVTIDALNPPTDMTFSNTPLSCPTNTTAVSIASVAGGTGTLEYQIIAPASAVTAYQASNTFAGLAPGTYTFRVRDANNCTYAETYNIAPLPPVAVNTVITKDLDCTVSPDAVINGSVTSGASPYTYSVSVNGGAYGAPVNILGTTFSYSTSTTGNYRFLITDANGCTVESSVQTVTAISLPEITSVVQTQPILCSGDSNAAIQITINSTVGTPPFTINVNNDSTGVNYGSQTSGLTAGNYTITLTDAKSCTDTATITISEPPPILVNHSTVDITCDPIGGVSKGSVIVDSVSGGTAPYNYYVTGTNGYSASELNASGTTSTTFDVVDFGLYQINVVDANGCSVLIQDVLVASPPDDLDITITSTVDCSLGGEAVVDVGTTLASAGPFFFSIYQGPSSVYPNPPGSWLPEDAPGSKTTTFTGLLPGVTYTFIVYDDSTGCSYYETATTPIPTNSTLTATALTSNNITCVGSADGNVSFTINSTYGVATNVNYEIFNSLSLVSTGVTGSGVVPAGGSLVVNNLGTLDYGTYFVYISETSGPNTGCGIATVPFNINESAIDLSITASVDKNANCNPSSGIISAIARDGTGPYLYQITTSATPPLATDPSWASASTFNRDTGNYYVHVKDAYGCIKSTSVIVLPSDPTPVISAVLDDQCDTLEGQFSIDVSMTTAGIGPYTYSIDGGAFQSRTAPFTISNLSSGTHTVEVRDFNGCGNLVTVIIEPPLNLTAAATIMPTCNDDDGEITINATGGSGNYAYTISPSAASISLSGNVFSGVPSGTYTITVTDTDTSCFEEVTVVVLEATPLSITTASSAVSCFGGFDGSFELYVNNYSGPYNYEVFDSGSVSVTGVVASNTSTNPIIVSGLSAGDYTLVVTETSSPFCSTTSGTITIASPPSALTLGLTETSNVTCDDGMGTITALASGGWGNYEYELTGAATIAYSSNSTFRNLSAGNYTVNVRDSSGCVVSENITLSLPAPITATVTADTTTLSCFGHTNATITVSAVAGGQGSNYSYTLNRTAPTALSSGPQSSPVFTGLGAGTYNVTVTDGYNCIFASTDITITEPSEIESLLVKETTPTCTTDAELTLSATGGTGPYEYSDTMSFATVLGSFTSSVTFNVAPGTYEYYVRDANSCIAVVSNEITVDSIPPLNVNLDTTNATVNCAGDSTAVIVAVAQGGLGNYVYTLQDAGGNDIAGAIQDGPGVFTGLPIGTYQVEVESGDCLSTSVPVTITEPSEPLTAQFLVTDVTCFGSNDGMIEVVASGGTGVIKYAISPQMDQFFDEPVFDNLYAGTYQVIVQDELGCYVLMDVTINEPAPVVLTVVPNSIVPELCEGDMNGAFSVDISGGSLPYSVALDDINGSYITGGPTQTRFDFTGLVGGNHTVYVIDGGGCETEWEIDFPDSISIDPVAVVEYTCDNNMPGNIVTVTVTGNADPADLSYSLNGGPYQSSNIFVNVVPGIGHYVDVMNVNGCTKRTPVFDVDQLDPVAVSLENGGFNEIVAVTTGGSGDYEYTLNGEPYGSANRFIIYESGTYTVTVTDSNGCTATASGYFEYIDVCIPNYFTPNGDGNMDEWGPGCTSQYKDIVFDIYDRYGRKVVTLKVGEKWDGTYNGKELPTGDYWYVVKLNDPKDDRDFVGHFTLYR